MSKISKDCFNYSLFIIILILFIFIFYENYQCDKYNKKELKKIISHKNVELPEISNTERLITESIIENYWKKRSLNKSNSMKIWNSIKSGAFRGAMGGLILGNTTESALQGALVFGTLSGLFKGYNMMYESTIFMLNDKQT